MFWVIFDTSTRRDYYRDVHNLLALPAGGTLRYDYNRKHMSRGALQQADAFKSTEPARALILYGQDRQFQKGGADPFGPLKPDAFWVGTRIANLRLLSCQVDRYYFDLEMLGYPTNDHAALMRVLTPLIGVGEVPFNTWVAISDRDVDFSALSNNQHAENWSRLVDMIGSPPSQFAGDTFWRIARILAGNNRVEVSAAFRQLTSVGMTTKIESVYTVKELEPLVLEIESRTPGHNGIADVPRRTINFSTVSTSPLNALTQHNIVVRRYAVDLVEARVPGTSRIDGIDTDLDIQTVPIEEGFPVGPDLALHFRVVKPIWRVWLAILLAIGSGGLFTVAAGLSELVLRVAFGALATIVGLVAYYLWTGEIKWPGSN